MAVWRAADRLKREFAAIVAPHGITLQQYNVLRILRDAGPQGLPTLAIADRMIERAPGITRLVDRLETKGLIARKRTESNRRQVLCYLTRQGLNLLSELDPLLYDAVVQVFVRLSDAQVTTLTKALSQLSDITFPDAKAGHGVPSFHRDSRGTR
jgi:DNA-binding MarR family transcriptional regulator